jgi:hypothetical protein
MNNAKKWWVKKVFSNGAEAAVMMPEVDHKTPNPNNGPFQTNNIDKAKYIAGVLNIKYNIRGNPFRFRAEVIEVV